MKNRKILVGFFSTVLLAVVLRLFIFDVVSISNDLLRPSFFSGDFLIVLKFSTPREGQWVLLSDYPKPQTYAVRRLVEKRDEKGWMVVEPAAIEVASSVSVLNEGKNIPVDISQIRGRIVRILWSLPCKPAAIAAGACEDKGLRFFKAVH